MMYPELDIPEILKKPAKRPVTKLGAPTLDLPAIELKQEEALTADLPETPLPDAGILDTPAAPDLSATESLPETPVLPKTDDKKKDTICCF